MLYIPNCLPRKNRLGKPCLHRSNFGGISWRKNTGDFPNGYAFGAQTVQNWLLKTTDLSKTGINMKWIGIPAQTI